MTEKVFAEGVNATPPSPRAPEFIKARLGIKVQHFEAWARRHMDDRGWVNIDIKESKGGKWYAELNTYKKTADGDDVDNGGYVKHEEELDPNDVPF